MNPARAVTESVPQDPKATPNAGVPWWWSRPWYEHQVIRGERLEAFSSLLWDGVYDYTYVARATTPGTFVAPPPKAEEMYAPETFGRHSGDRVMVEGGHPALKCGAAQSDLAPLKARLRRAPAFRLGKSGDDERSRS